MLLYKMYGINLFYIDLPALHNLYFLLPVEVTWVSWFLTEHIVRLSNSHLSAFHLMARSSE
jgi:hypothetical protein